MELIFGGNIPSRKKNKPIIRLKNGHGFMRIGLSIFFSPDEITVTEGDT